jgi:hypothetical protein
MKVRPVGAEMFRADSKMDIRTDGRTDMTKLIVAFAIYSNAPNTPRETNKYSL